MKHYECPLCGQHLGILPSDPKAAESARQSMTNDHECTARDVADHLGRRVAELEAMVSWLCHQSEFRRVVVPDRFGEELMSGGGFRFTFEMAPAGAGASSIVSMATARTKE